MIQVPELFFTFSRTFNIKVPGIFQDFQQNSRTFQDFYGVNRIAPTKFLFRKKCICNVYYILLYQFFTPGNWSFIIPFWLRHWKTESDYWTWFFSQYKWSKDGVHQVCLAFFWHNIRKISIGNWLPFINLQMDTSHVYQTKCFQNKTDWTHTKSENEMHAYWYNIDANS